MKFWKSALILILFTFYFVLGATSVKSQNEFLVDALVQYNVQDSGQTEVLHDITVENNFSTLYATTYTLSLENIDAQNISAKDDKGEVLKTEVSQDSGKTNIKIVFSEAVVGKGQKRHFIVSYINKNFAVRTGEVWEVSVPRLADTDSYRDYSVSLFIPNSFGLEAYISPQPKSASSSDQGKTYLFSKDQIIQTGITAGFGQFQVFSFNLSYHLENPLGKTAQTEISLPPDTAFQKIYLSKITPKPSDVKLDTDGNWIAVYNLSARQRVDVSVAGSVQIFASYRPFPQPTQEVLSSNLRETQYWQVNDPKIKALAAELKTPKAIYDYVSKTLKYDFGRVVPNVQRYGAVKALQNPDQAICMEFTDLFIAIARAAGIPAREINGYAYTENPELQPLSLVADVLHSWPEYYDSAKGAWIPVDPTWGSTTGGVDYFSKLDLRHFTFVIHGRDSIKPFPPGSYKLGVNPQKDVYVSFGKLPQVRNSIPRISASVIRNIPFFSFIYSIKIENPGPSALYNLYPTVYFDNKQENRNFISLMPPYSSKGFNITVPFSLLAKDTPDRVRINVEGSELSISTNKTQVLINSLLILFALFIIILLLVLIRLKKITFNRLAPVFTKIWKIWPKN
ncbi:MAG TPA: transglutaminase domain-containing protein [Patescibacteria group bacterium]|nr:transglutaminase domain-containing protein [Patescibacteria group bacterium]